MALIQVGLCWFPTFDFAFQFPPPLPAFELPIIDFDIEIDLSCPLN